MAPVVQLAGWTRLAVSSLEASRPRWRRLPLSVFPRHSYAGGVLLGYRQYARLHEWPPPNKLTLATPSLATLAITFSACMIVVIAISSKFHRQRPLE